MDIDNVIQKKKKRMKKGILIEFCSLLTHNKVPKTHPFCKKKVQTSKKQRAHMPYFSDRKVKAHTPTFILFVKLCKKPIFFFFLKKKDDINIVPQVEEACHKNSTMTHSLHSFKSPDIILSATRRQKTQKKLLHQWQCKQSKGLYAPILHHIPKPSCAKHLCRINSKCE